MSKAEDDYNGIVAFAKRIFTEDEGDKAESFINSSMERLGHKRKTMWEDGGNDDSGNGGDFFGGRGSSGETRSARKNNDGNSKPWGY